MSALPNSPSQDEATDEYILHAGDWTIAPQQLIHSRAVTDGAVRLYLHLKWIAGQSKKNWQARANIASEMYISEATVDNRIGELMANDWIVGYRRFKPDGARRSNTYHIFEVQDAAINWREQHADDEMLIQKPKVKPRKSRAGIGGRPHHKPKETQVSVGADSQETEEAAPSANENLSMTGGANSSTNELDQVSFFELDQVSNTPSSFKGGAAEPLPALTTKVINRQTLKGKIKDHQNHEYIGRFFGPENLPASDWRNQYKIHKGHQRNDGTRIECIALWLKDILRTDSLMGRLPELRGKTLVCWCDPELCHGHLLKALIETNEVRLKYWRNQAQTLGSIALLTAFMDEVLDEDIKSKYTKALGDHGNDIAAQSKTPAPKVPTKGSYQSPKPETISPDEWAPCGRVADNHHLIAKTGYYMVDNRDRTVYLLRFSRYAAAKEASEVRTGTAAIGALRVKEALGDYILLKHKSDAGITPEEKAIIDGFYDGLPEDIRPLERVYDGKNRECAQLMLKNNWTPEIVKAIVIDQYKGNYWPNIDAPMTMPKLRDYGAFWLKKLSPTALGEATGINPYLLDDYFNRRDEEELPIQGNEEAAPIREVRKIDDSLCRAWRIAKENIIAFHSMGRSASPVNHCRLVEAHDNTFWLDGPTIVDRWLTDLVQTSLKERLADVLFHEKARAKDIRIVVECQRQLEGFDADQLEASGSVLPSKTVEDPGSKLLI